MKRMSCLWIAICVLAPGCAKFKSSLEVINPDCSADINPAGHLQLFYDPATSASFLSEGGPNLAIFSGINTMIGSTNIQNGFDFVDARLACDNPSGDQAPACGFFLNNDALSSHLTPANIEVSANLIYGASIIARADTSGDVILLQRDADTGDINLVVSSNGTPTTTTCTPGVDSVTQCPTGIYDNPGSFDLKVTGCSPQISIGVVINGISPPKLNLTSVTGTNQGNAGFLLSPNTFGATSTLNTVYVYSLSY